MLPYRVSFVRLLFSTPVKKIFQVESYLRHQGKKFIIRNFDANAYITLTQLMDSHDLAEGRKNIGNYYDVLKSIKIPMLIVGISSDILYPISGYYT